MLSECSSERYSEPIRVQTYFKKELYIKKINSMSQTDWAKKISMSSWAIIWFSDIGHYLFSKPAMDMKISKRLIIQNNTNIP